jgi:hypothetical protein
LVIAEPHQNRTDYVASAALQNLQLNLQRSLPPAGKTERLAENVWQIPLDSDMHFFASLIQCMNSFDIPVRVLFSDEAPAWAQHPPVLPSA